ncbi:hypothetical protein Hanom_Chr16g01464731 [Helianthus anomalus]
MFDLRRLPTPCDGYNSFQCYLKAVRELCSKHTIYLMFTDDIQSVLK